MPQIDLKRILGIIEASILEPSQALKHGIGLGPERPQRHIQMFDKDTWHIGLDIETNIVVRYGYQHEDPTSWF